MNKKRLIIFSDYGLDDAVALAYILRRRELFDGIDIVAVAGNVSASKSLNNALRLVSAAGGAQGNIRVVGTSSINQPTKQLTEVHGGDGMGDLVLNETEKQKIPVSYREFAESVKDLDYTVLSLGPLTVPKEFFRETESFGELIVMAGVVNEKPNYMDMEFNQALDESSYNYILKNYPCAVATLDTCRNRGFNLAGARFGAHTLLNVLLNRAVELAEKRHPDNAYIYDFIASLFLIEPDLFEISGKKDKWGNTVPQLSLKDKKFCLEKFIKSI